VAEKYSFCPFNLGVCYANGEGVLKDQKEAVTWYHKAAEQGHSNAQVMLGSCYLKGDGVQESQANAMVWFRKSAAQGNVYAAQVLSSISLLSSGVGAGQNLQKSSYENPVFR
jgi:uncharacterized protein